MNTSTNLSQFLQWSGKMPLAEAAVEYLSIDCRDTPAIARVTRFCGAGGTMEYHITVRLTAPVPEADAVCHLTRAYQYALAAVDVSVSSAVFRRIFCSDVVNQAHLVKHPVLGIPATGGCAVSLVGQPPLPAKKFSLWAYHICDPPADLKKSFENGTVSLRRGGLTHHWTAGLTDCVAVGPYEQTRRVMEDYDAWLRAKSMTMATNVVRTWWFMQNVDADYQGLVEARRDFFSSHGLTTASHYIASTGIEGAHPAVAARVSLDSYAISGLQEDQVTYLAAPEHLCPTHDYGVTFERATSVAFADRKHVYVSGTASIDHTGRMLFEGDVVRQLDRTLENIEALLKNVSANLGDLAMIIVYLRDPADGAAVDAALNEKMGTIPYVLVQAPVCRPVWLIEIEGIAIVPASLPKFPHF
ncbi:MAG: Rid family hydrolase [Luteolibacter sp.]